ncbi:MAG: type II toxin-antitoxin system VapB family antitoxin [Deltaproteobacteria bacterium]|nr:type II toxin-antitoxin system VapB family antitoxin [Deltaproteobacteria bacterium]
MARTNIILDDHLIKEAGRLTKIKTKKQLVHHALEMLVKAERRKKMLSLEGKVYWQGNLSSSRKSRKWSS